MPAELVTACDGHQRRARLACAFYRSLCRAADADGRDWCSTREARLACRSHGDTQACESTLRTRIRILKRAGWIERGDKRTRWRLVSQAGRALPEGIDDIPF